MGDVANNDKLQFDQRIPTRGLGADAGHRRERSTGVAEDLDPEGGDLVAGATAGGPAAPLPGPVRTAACLPAPAGGAWGATRPPSHA